MNLRTPLSVARGLGSAKDGTHHFWMQRLTAVALVAFESVVRSSGSGCGQCRLSKRGGLGEIAD